MDELSHLERWAKGPANAFVFVVWGDRRRPGSRIIRDVAPLRLEADEVLSCGCDQRGQPRNDVIGVVRVPESRSARTNMLAARKVWSVDKATMRIVALPGTDWSCASPAIDGVDGG